MEQFPSLPTEATHRVSVDSRLALRDKPAFKSTSDSAKEDNHHKGKIIDMLPNGTRLIVIDEAVGYKCEWAEVLVEGSNYGKRKLFVSNKFIQKLDGTAESALYVKTKKSVGIPHAPPIVFWTAKRPNVPFFDANSAHYKVCVETQYTSTGGELIMSRLEEATKTGLGLILQYMNKRSDPDYISFLMGENYFQFARATEYSVPTTKGSYLKVLVSLPHRYVPPLEDASNVSKVYVSAGGGSRTTLSPTSENNIHFKKPSRNTPVGSVSPTPIVTDSTGSSAEDDLNIDFAQEYADNFMDTVVEVTTVSQWDMQEKVKLRCLYNTDKFSGDIEKAAKLMEAYAEDIDGFNGTVIDFDARTEAQRLRAIPSILSQLFMDNNLPHDPFSKKEKLEIGWDSTLTPVWVSLTMEDGSSVNFASGIHKFADTMPIDSQRNQGYLWQLNLIVLQSKETMTWTEFVSTFTFPSPPTIMPGQDNKTAAGDISNTSGLAKRKANALDNNPVKRYSDKFAEDRYLADVEFKRSLFRDRVNASEFVGSSLASKEGLLSTVDKISTVDDAFGNVLDRLHIFDLIKEAMDCIIPELNTSMPEMSVEKEVGFGPFSVTASASVGATDDSAANNAMTPGVGQTPDVSVDYDWSNPSGLEDCDVCNISNMENTSIDDFGLGGATLEDLGLESESASDVGLGDSSYDDLNAGDTSLGDTNLGDYRIGDLGAVPDWLGNKNYKDIDFDDLSVGDLGLDLSGFTIEQIGLGDMRIRDAGFVIEDFGLTDEGLVEQGIDVDANLVGQDAEDLTFRQLGLAGMLVDDLDFDDLAANDLMIDHTLNYLEANLDDLKFTSAGADATLSDLGLSNDTLKSLGIASLTVSDLGLGGTTLADLGLGGATVASLGMTGRGMAEIGGSLAEMGFEEAAANISAYGLDDTVEEEDTENSTSTNQTLLAEGALEFSVDIEKAMKTLQEQIPAMPDFDPFGDWTFPQNQKLPDLSIELPDNLPTTDIMGSLGEAVLAALQALLGLLFIAMVKTVLETLISLCEENDNLSPGASNLNEMLGDSDNPSATPLVDLMAALGTCTGTSGARAPNSDAARNIAMGCADNMRTMLDDISTMFTPRELCMFINGTASDRMLTIARNYITRSYPDLGLTHKTQISDFFKGLGTLIDPAICAALMQECDAPSNSIIGEIMCTPNEMECAMKNLLVNKGDDITDEQIQQICDRTKQRKVNAAKVLADMVNKGPLSGNYVAPPVFCEKNGGAPGVEAGSIGDDRAGLMDMSHPVLDFANSIAVDNLFKQLEITWSRDMKDYPRAFTQDTDEDGGPEKQEIYLDEDEEVLNPALEAQYGKEKLIKKIAKSQGYGTDETGWYLATPTKVRKSAPALYHAFREMETSDTLVFKDFDVDHPALLSMEDSGITGIDDIAYDLGGFGIELMLPQDVSGDLAAIEMAASSDGVSGEVKEKMAEAINSMKNASASHYMYYILPKRTQSEIEDEDNYINSCAIVIMKVTNDSGGSDKQVVYRRVIEESVGDEIFSGLESMGITGDSSLSVTNNITRSQYAFSMLMRNQWSKAVGSSIANNVFSALVDPESWSSAAVMGDGAYAELYRDMFAYVSQRIANGPYFQNVQSTSDALTGDTAIATSTPVVEFLDLDPEPSPEQIVNQTDTSLLSLSDAKKCLASDMKNAQCVDHSRPTDGSPASALSPTEEAIMKTAISSIIRTYMIDYYLRGLFTNSIFVAPDEPDDIYIKHFSSFMSEDFRMYDKPNQLEVSSDKKVQTTEAGKYESEFSKMVIELYESTDEERDGTTGSPMGDDAYTLAIASAIKEEYPKVIEQMKESVPMSGTASESLDADFVDNYLKKINIVDYGSFESKFFDPTWWGYTVQSIIDSIDDGVKDIQQLATQLEVDAMGAEFAEFDNESQSASTVEGGTVIAGTSMADIDWTNGNLYLEKYYLLEDHDTQPEWWNDQMEQTSIFKNRGVSFNINRPDMYKYFGVVSESDYLALENDLPPTVDMISSFRLVSADGSGVSTGQGAFKSVKQGIRIMYLPPTNESEIYTVVTEDGEPEFNTVWNYSSSPTSIASAMRGDVFKKAGSNVDKETAVLTKAYKIIEKMKSGTVTITREIDLGSGSVKTESETKTVGVYKETHPVPLVEYEESIRVLKTGQITSPSAWTSFNDRFIQSGEYKAFTKHIFPISYIKSVLSLYSFQSVSSMHEIATALNPSKDELRRIFFAVNNKGGYQQEDPALAEVGGLAGLDKMMKAEFGARERAPGPNSWNYNLPLPWGKKVKGMGFESVAKATKTATLRMFKQHVESSDPNIKIASKLMMASKLMGVPIPATAWSFMILPMNVFPPPVGFGPPLTPLSIGYHVLGLGIFAPSKGDSDALEGAFKNAESTAGSDSCEDDG